MRHRGFTLLEVLLVVTILGIVAAVVIPRITSNYDTANDHVCDHNCLQINAAIERYYLSTGAWPATDLSDLAADPNYFPEGLPTCPVSGAAYRLETSGGAYRVLGHTNGSHSP